MAESTVLLDRNERDHGLAVSGDLDDVRFCFLDGLGKVAGRLREPSDFPINSQPEGGADARLR